MLFHQALYLEVTSVPADMNNKGAQGSLTDRIAKALSVSWVITL
jgi:hypothetical protein